MPATTRWSALCLALTFATGVAAPATARDRSCDDFLSFTPDREHLCALGTLPDGNWNRASGISGDGLIVVGTSDSIHSRDIPEGPVPSNYGSRAFRWSVETGMQSLGTLEGGAFSSGQAVSADGSIVVGSSDSTEGWRAFRWTQEQGMQSLGVLAGGRSSTANEVNADGSVVVGTSGSTAGTRAFRWTEEQGMRSLGVLPGARFSEGFGVNAAGNVVVGTSGTTDNWQLAFRWVEGQGMTSLGSFPGSIFSTAVAVNAEGNVVVGGAFDERMQGIHRPFRWVEGEGMHALDVLPELGWSSATDVDDSGNVVVGFGYAGISSQAFRWVEGEGMHLLGVLTGGTSSTADSVSGDGNTVVGSSVVDGQRRAFIWRGGMQDFENLRLSFPVLGQDSAVAFAQQQQDLAQVMSRGSLAASGQSVLTVQAIGRRTERNPTKIGARENLSGRLSLGYGISDRLSVGGTLSLSNTRLKNNAFDMGTGSGGALWARYSADGAAQTGLQAGAALGYMRNSGDIARGRLLTDVQLATGRSRVTTRAAQVWLGFGIAQDNWRVTPTLGLSRSETRRAAYTETGAGFTTRYDALRVLHTSVTLGMTGEIAAGPQGRILFGAQAEHDLRRTPLRLSGSSDIPGLERFNIDPVPAARRTRASATLGYRHDLATGASITGEVSLGQAAYGRKLTTGAGLTYALRF